MQATDENAKTQTDTQSAPAIRSPAAQARLAEVVQVAYILQARTR